MWYLQFCAIGWLCTVALLESWHPWARRTKRTELSPSPHPRSSDALRFIKNTHIYNRGNKYRYLNVLLPTTYSYLVPLKCRQKFAILPSLKNMLVSLRKLNIGLKLTLKLTLYFTNVHWRQKRINLINFTLEDKINRD